MAVDTLYCPNEPMPGGFLTTARRFSSCRSPEMMDTSCCKKKLLLGHRAST